MKKLVIILTIAVLLVSSVLAEDSSTTVHAADVARVLSVKDDGSADFAFETTYDFTYEIEDSGNVKRAKWNAWIDGLFIWLNQGNTTHYVETASVNYIEKESTMHVDYDYTDGKSVTIDTEAYYRTGEKEITSIDKYVYEEEYEKAATVGIWLGIILGGLFYLILGGLFC